MAHAATLDTLSIARRLKSRGVAQEHAEAIADELLSASQVDTTHLATREELQVFKSELKSDIRELELRIGKNMEALKSELIRWVIGIEFAQVAMVLAVLKLS